MALSRSASVGFQQPSFSPTDEDRQNMAELLPIFEEVLKPSTDAKAIETTIIALLSSYNFGLPLEPSERSAKIYSYSDSLEEFPLWAVQKTAKYWRDNESAQPTVVDLRKKAMKFCHFWQVGKTEMKNALQGART